jgi:Protein of unknown function (DUF998)
MVSKLFAVGSPPRPTLIVIVGVYTVLMIAFGFGVWASAHGNRALHVTAVLLIAYGVSNIVALFFRWTSVAALQFRCTSWPRSCSSY